MNKNKLPPKVKQEALKSVMRYNDENRTLYNLRFRSEFAYLERIDGKVITKIGRLKYLPESQKWDFAVFKCSTERYDPNEWLFPGRELLDGTIEGAMEAGMIIYPPTPGTGIGFNILGCLLMLLFLPFRLLIRGIRKLFGR